MNTALLHNRSAWRWLVLIGVILGVVLAASAAATQTTPTATADDRVTTQVLEVWLGEGKIVGEDADGEETIIGEYHRWEPRTLVVRQGDNVVLKVRNPRKHAHSLVMQNDWYDLDTGVLAAREGQTVLRFTADVPGVFTYECGIDWDPEKGICDPDHSKMNGQLIVLAQ